MAKTMSTQTMSTQLELGERLKKEWQEHIAATNEEWLKNVLAVIENHARWADTFTIENVRQFCDLRGVPEPQSPNAWGAAFSAAAKQGIIRRVGYTKNKLASAHSRIVSVWSGQQ